MLASLPSFAYHFGIRPWEIELLTFDEIAEFTDAVQEMVNSAKQQK